MKKIMIVDDHKDYLDGLAELVELFGYEVMVISNANKVRIQASIQKPNVIILDLRMDEANGFDIAEELKRNPETKHIELVALTGYYRRIKDRVKMLKYGFKDCILNPAELLDVLSAIEIENVGEVSNV